MRRAGASSDRSFPSRQTTKRTGAPTCSMSIACSKVTRASPRRIVPSSATRCPSTESEHVARLQHAVRRPAGSDAVHDDAAEPGGQPPLAAIGGGEERRRLEARVREAVVAAVLQVREEVADDRDGDEEAHVVGAREALEGDAHHLAVLDDRAAAVAGVDGRVRLHDEVRVGAAVHVATRLDARDDAGGRGDVLPAEREAVGDDPRARARERAQGQGAQARGRRRGRPPGARPGRSRSPPPRASPRTGSPRRGAARGSAGRRR